MLAGLGVDFFIGVILGASFFVLMDSGEGLVSVLYTSICPAPSSPPDWRRFWEF